MKRLLAFFAFISFVSVFQASENYNMHNDEVINEYVMPTKEIIEKSLFGVVSDDFLIETNLVEQIANKRGAALVIAKIIGDNFNDYWKPLRKSSRRCTHSMDVSRAGVFTKNDILQAILKSVYEGEKAMKEIESIDVREMHNN